MTKDVQTPKGWLVAGNNPQHYNFLLDTKVFHSGSASGKLESNEDKPTGFGTLMQDFSAEKYLGKRMRFSAFVKTKNVTGWAGLWMKVEGAGHDSLGFDNMKDRAITGTSDWTEYEVILDIPKDSKLVAFGILLSGKGTVWIDDITFEETKNKVTNMEPSLPTTPTNLDFQEKE